MTKRKSELEFVSKEDCNRQHAKIDLALFGPDGRGGMVKDITDIKNFMADQDQRNANAKTEKKEQCSEEKTRKRDYKSFIFAIIGGGIVAFVNYLIRIFG